MSILFVGSLGCNLQSYKVISCCYCAVLQRQAPMHFVYQRCSHSGGLEWRSSPRNWYLAGQIQIDGVVEDKDIGEICIHVWQDEVWIHVYEEKRNDEAEARLHVVSESWVIAPRTQQRYKSKAESWKPKADCGLRKRSKVSMEGIEPSISSVWSLRPNH